MPVVGAAVGFVGGGPAWETDCLSLHDFASSPDDGNNSHSSEWWQTERGGERKERKAKGDGDLLSRSICCHLRQSKQRFGLEREQKMNTLNIDLELLDGSSDCFVTLVLDLRAEYDRQG